VSVGIESAGADVDQKKKPPRLLGGSSKQLDFRFYRVGSMDVGLLSDNWMLGYGWLLLTPQRCEGFVARPKFGVGMIRLLPVNSSDGK
jgi:hypothetical protein